MEGIDACFETAQRNSPYKLGAYTIMNSWYRYASMRQTNPSQGGLEKVSGDYAALYQQEDLSPLERPVPTHVNTFQTYNIVPTEAEVAAEVFHLMVNGTRFHTHMQAKHFKMWLREVYPEKEATGPPETSKMYKTCGDTPVQV